jgi:hypothetical protein
MVSLNPGESSSGCVIFQIPSHAIPVEFDYQPDQGFGTSGQWKLEATPGGATSGIQSVGLKTAADRFKKDLTPVRSALLSFGTAASGWTDATTDAQAEADAQPLLNSLYTFQTKLERQQWPGSATWDIRCLVVQAGPLEGLLLGLATVSAAGTGTWLQGLAIDLAGLVTSTSLVRADLHISAASPSISQHL